MPKAAEVALELRKLADSLDRGPDTEITPAALMFHVDEKEIFKGLVRILPHPLTKSIFLPDSKYPYLHMTYDSKGLRVIAAIKQSLSCELIEPAKPAVYRCEPILSEAEEAALETAVAE